MPQNVPTFSARSKTIGSTGLTDDINADHAQIVKLSEFANTLPTDFVGSAALIPLTPGMGSNLSIVAGSVAWDAGGKFQDFRSLTLDQTAALQLPTNVPAGGAGFLRVFQNAQGGYGLTAPQGATSHVPPGFGVNSSANKLVALIGYVFDGTNFYWNVTRYN